MKNFLVSVLLLSALSGFGFAAGDPQAGKDKVATCAACHGADGNSSLAIYPKLAGQNAKYLLKQLKDIQSGARAVPLMTGMLNNSSEQDLADMAAYFAGQAKTVGFAKSELVEEGQRIYRAGIAAAGVAACTACHSPTGAGNGPAGFPALSGQHADYIAAQLKAFRSGERNNDGDTKMMRNVALNLKDAEIDALASYISGLH